MIADIPNYIFGSCISPDDVYISMKRGYMKKISKRCRCYLPDMEKCCDRCARTLFADLHFRKPFAENLILSYQEAKELFEIFQTFIDTWVKMYTEN